MNTQKQRFDVVTVEKTGPLVTCHRISCSYKWVYTGHRNIACCPNCHTSVMIGPFEEHVEGSKKDQGEHQLIKDAQAERKGSRGERCTEPAPTEPIIEQHRQIKHPTREGVEQS
jgi:hypothetical protein